MALNGSSVDLTCLQKKQSINIMSMINDYNNRQLVPRLLPFRTANILSLNINASKNNIFNTNAFELKNYHRLKTEWKIEKNIILAIQILIYEIIHDSLTVSFELIDYLKNRKQQLNHIENEILSLACHKKKNDTMQIPQYSSVHDIKTIIRNLKEENRINQLNPFQWCDLGFYYTKMGLKEKAKKAFLIAINLNNSNRYVVRSVARFFLHIGDIEFAHKILTDSPRIKIDVGLISAEIAFSELMGKKSKFIDQGVGLKDDKNISIMEKNELLAQIATLEYLHGKNSKGRKLVEECLISPNENSLAQFAFLEKKNIIDPIYAINSVIFQYEALARNYFADAEFQKSFENAKAWYDFQPFSNRPATLAVYIASAVLDNYREAIDIAETALKITPSSFLLKNNLAYAYAKNDQITEAVRVLKRINKSEIDDYDKAVLNATTGFIAFKLGNANSAKIGYNEAIKYFRLIKDDISLARALYNYSNVLESINKVDSINILREVAELSQKNSIVELNYLLKNKMIHFGDV
jgi:tetratricopeptide (TPR) repeat protein